MKIKEFSRRESVEIPKLNQAIRVLGSILKKMVLNIRPIFDPKVLLNTATKNCLCSFQNLQQFSLFLMAI